MASNDEIMKHHDADPKAAVWVPGPSVPHPLVVVASDPGWTAVFGQLESRIRTALGREALAVEHIGSTAVAGLEAKPVIDIDLTVPDPADETAYLKDLEAAGFVLVVREPDWHEHRCLRLQKPAANVHVFGPDCPETIRHRLFRDWLRSHPADRELYAEAKRLAVVQTTAAGGTVMDYNLRKEPVIRAIYDRIFAGSGLTGTRT